MNREREGNTRNISGIRLFRKNIAVLSFLAPIFLLCCPLLLKSLDLLLYFLLDELDP